MNQTGFKQISLGLRIAGFTTASLLLLLASAIYGFSFVIVLLGASVLAVILLLPPAAPWLNRRFGGVDFFSPYVIFPVLYSAWYIAASINFVQLPSEMFYGYFDPIPAWMYGLFAFGLCSYFCGIFLGRLLPIGSSAITRRQIDYAIMQRILFILMIVVFIAWAILGIAFGITILHLDTANSDRLAHRGALYQLFTYLGWTIIIFSPILSWARGATKRFDWLYIVAIPALTAMLLVSLGAGRSPVAIPLVTLIIARSFFKKQPLWKLALIGVTIFGLFSTFGYIRGRSSNDAPEFSLMELAGIPAAVGPFIDMAADIRFSVAALRDLTKIVPSSVPYQHGAVTLLPLSTFLPGHQDMSDMVFKQMLGHDFEGSGEPATILGPLYVDFGWIGVFVGMNFYGVLLSWTYRRMKAQPTSARIINYAWWLQCCLVGIFSNGFSYVYVILLPAFWAVLFFIAMQRSYRTIPGQIQLST